MHIELGTREDACLLAIDRTPHPAQQALIVNAMNATYGVQEREQALFERPLTEDDFEHIVREDGSSYSVLHLYYGNKMDRAMSLAHRAASRIVDSAFFLNEEVTVDRNMYNVQYESFFRDYSTPEDMSMTTTARQV